ncbi:hypothetical protein Csp1_01210 [Corynebacterium provencense]|uniref:Ribbon-helix-helix protein CopG domain-containing protein n=1 Tax=Corynebacterium provencense TaxID=1737425 RepID=A0A2Z3YMT0_9CORY|nr:hypothetical protein [Corynebacterium provencense]AWT24949.1 hypothetical protein Csp1_01210 [Corynebacterium provencense]
MDGENLRAPFGRPRRQLPADGLMRLQIRVPARLGRLVYAQSAVERRHLGAIVAQALDEYYRRHPEQSWTSMT